jgi:acetyl-CoA C-acetyltransferase
VGIAAAAGVPREKWVFLHGYADLRELNLLDRPDLSSGPASVRAAVTALERACATPEDIGTFDLYSCFAIPVFNICDGIGLSHTDPRGLTLTGGLPFFGGAGNNYSMHGISETVARVRELPGTRGFVGANGGSMSKYSVGIYSVEPRAFEVHNEAAAQDVINSGPRAVNTKYASGQASVETYTVTTNQNRAWVGIVVGRLANGTRTLAVTDPGDTDVLQFLTSEEPFGCVFAVDTDGRHNTASAFKTAS